MACPPGNCASWAAFRLCKPLPPICLGCEYDPGELQMLWFCWRARSTGEYGGLTPVDLAPGIIDISGKTNIAKIIEYCQSRGTLVAPFTNFNRFGFKFNLTNIRTAGALANFGGFAGGVDAGDVPIAPAAGGTGGGGGGGTCSCTPDNGSDLTVVVCTELDCQASEPKIEITVCGGTPPYQWTLSGGEDLSGQQSGTNNRNVSVTPPSTTTVAGEAYEHGFEVTKDDAVCLCTCGNRQHAEPKGCEDESEGVCRQTSFGEGTFGITCQPDPPDDCGFPVGLPDECANCAKSGVKDIRTQQMKDDGCKPCGTSFDGAIITVTDDVGTQVSTVVIVT